MTTHIPTFKMLQWISQDASIERILQNQFRHTLSAVKQRLLEL